MSRRKEKNSCFAKAEKTGRTVACYAAAPALFRSVGEGEAGVCGLAPEGKRFSEKRMQKTKRHPWGRVPFPDSLFAWFGRPIGDVFNHIADTAVQDLTKIVDLCRADAVAAPHARKCCRADAVFVDERVSRDPLLFQCAPKRRIADHNSVASFRKRWVFSGFPKNGLLCSV